MQWWTQVPSHSNGKLIHRPLETAYMHIDKYGYGLLAVLNMHKEARGCWSEFGEEEQT
jgi:hypothetical protein